MEQIKVSSYEPTVSIITKTFIVLRVINLLSYILFSEILDYCGKTLDDS